MKVLEVDKTTGTIKFQFKDNVMTFVMDFKDTKMPSDEGLIATILINMLVYFKKRMCCTPHFVDAVETGINKALEQEMEEATACDAKA